MRHVIRECLDCQRQKNACPGEQFMGSVPEDRIIHDKPHFTFVGVDHFGLLEVKQGTSHVKRNGCLFTCLTTRVVDDKCA